jgi:hypothetical protein
VKVAARISALFVGRAGTKEEIFRLMRDRNLTSSLCCNSKLSLGENQKLH